MRKRSLEGIDVKFELGRLTINGHDILIPNISFIEEIRPRGSNGLVFKCTDTVLRRLVAAKIWIPRQNDPRDRNQQALAEASKIAQLNHNNIVHIYQCSQLPNGWVYSIMEYVNGVNLDAFIKANRSDFSQRFRLWKQIEKVLEYSHKSSVFHGDLHSGNILIIDETVKVIDFGTSIFASKKIDSEMRETRLLIALNKKLFGKYGISLSDVIDVDLKVINPVRVLDVLSVWVDILFEWRQMFHVQRREDWLITQVEYLAFHVMQAPVFSVPRLVQQLARKKVSINVQNHFIARCVCWAIVFLEPPGRTKRYNLPVWYLNKVGLDPRVNKALLKEKVTSLRKIFWEKGRFQ